MSGNSLGGNARLMENSTVIERKLATENKSTGKWDT